MNAYVEGQSVSVGDYVYFKSDIEQAGVIVKITSGYYGKVLHLENKNGFSGEYIGGQTLTQVDPNDCWG